MKGRAFIIQRQGVTGALDLIAQSPFRQFQRPYPFADAACHFFHRQAVGGDRVPQPHESNPLDRPVLALVVGIWDQQIPHPSERFLHPQHGVEVLSSKCAIGVLCPLGQLRFGLVGDEALIDDEPHHHSHGEGASAESKSEDFIFARLIVAAHELVEVEDVALEPPAERSAEDRKRLEG
jgi:hypothetical protein